MFVDLSPLSAYSKEHKQYTTGPEERYHTPARLSHRFSTAAADKAALTRPFSPFDLDVTRHAVVRRAPNKSRYSNLLHRPATKTSEITVLARRPESGRVPGLRYFDGGLGSAARAVAGEGGLVFCEVYLHMDIAAFVVLVEMGPGFLATTGLTFFGFGGSGLGFGPA